MRYYFLIACVIVLGCNNKNATSKKFVFYPSQLANDSAKKILLEYVNRDAALFNLPAIQKGVDSFEMRIREWNVFDNGANLYILKVDSNGWKGYHYNSYTNFRNKYDNTKVKLEDRLDIGDSVFMIKQFVPVCGWKNLMDSLYALKIDTLPSQSMIKDFKHQSTFDGGGYSIEIATPYSYRFLDYSNPEIYEYRECKGVMQLINLLKRQTGNCFEWPNNPQDSNIQPNK